VPKLKQLGDLTPHIPTRNPSPEYAKWQSIFDAVFQKTGGGSIWLKRMRMFPVRERTRNLDIRKVTAFFKVQMFRDPPPPKRPSPKLQDDARPAFNPAGFFDHSYVLAGRGKPLERPRQGVPRVNFAR